MHPARPGGRECAEACDARLRRLRPTAARQPIAAASAQRPLSSIDGTIAVPGPSCSRCKRCKPPTAGCKGLPVLERRLVCPRACSTAMALALPQLAGCGMQAAPALKRPLLRPKPPGSSRCRGRAAWRSKGPVAAAQRSSGGGSSCLPAAPARGGRAAAADAGSGSLQDAGAGGRATAAQATASLINCAVGAGILSMPYAFSLTGWALGLGLTGARRGCGRGRHAGCIPRAGTCASAPAAALTSLARTHRPTARAPAPP